MESRLPLREESRVGTARASHPVDKGRLEIQRGFRGMKRPVRLLLSSLLAGTWLASLVLPAGASWSALTPQASLWDTGEELVVPSLPNNENYLGTGPWHGVLALANASAFPVTVEVKKADGTLLTSLSLPGNGSTAIAAGTVFGSGADSGLVLSAREQGGCAPQAVQEFTVTRGSPAGTTDAVSLPIPSGISVTNVIVSRATTLYSSPTDYQWTQVGTTLNVDWSPAGAEPSGNSVYSVQVAYDRPCRPARISAAVKLVAPAPSSNGRTASTHQMVTGHTALAKGQAVGSTIVVPIVQANYSGWKTILHITNFGSSPCAVTANFYQNPSGSLTHTANQTVAAGATWQLDVQTVLPGGWLGSARITGTGCALAASLDRIKPQQSWGTTVNMALTNLGLPSGQLTNTVYVPLVFQAYFNWNTGLAVTNAGPNPATVTINYYGTNGGLLATSSLGPILPGAMGFDYLTGSGGQLAQALITSTQPIIVSVDAVKYTGGGPDVGQALSSMGINGPLGTIPAAMPALRIPLFQKAGGSGNDTSGIQIWNVGGAAATVNVDFFDSSGAPVPPSTFTLPGIAPNGAVTVYAPTVGPLSANYQGEVRITVTAGGPVVAVTNNVNYDVQYDGSAAFNVATSQRSLRVDFGRTSNKNGVPTLLVAQTVDENGVQMPAQQILITDGGAGLTITPSSATTTLYGIATAQLVGTNTVANVTVCWDLNNSSSCDANEPQVTQSMSWSP